MPVAAKTTWHFWWYLSNKSIIQKTFEGEMSIRTLPTPLLQIVNKQTLDSWVIFESTKGPDDSRQVNLQARMGYENIHTWNMHMAWYKWKNC